MVRTDDGIKMFTQGDVDKRGVKIMRSGKPAQISDLRTGDRLTATIITTKPPQVLTEREVKATLATAPALLQARLGLRQHPPSAATSGSPASAPSARTLPKTASPWPFLGLASVLSLAIGLALSCSRRMLQ
jgi:hypothetical protein